MTEDKITEIVSMIRKEFPDCAITLSLGEMEYESYKRFFDAGANRYLLRHETADARHYGKLHPDPQYGWTSGTHDPCDRPADYRREPRQYGNTHRKSTEPVSLLFLWPLCR